MQIQSKISKFIIIFLTLICIIQSATIAYFYIDVIHQKNANSYQSYDIQPEPVNVCIIDKKSFAGFVYTYGQIKAKNSITFKSANFQSYAPKVSAINFKAGQKVKKGDVLLEFKCPEMVLKCEALFKEAEQKKILYDKLLSLKSASPTYETNKAGCEYDKAILEAKAMQETMKNLIIQAPFDGTVSHCDIHIEETITDPHKPLFSIYDEDNLTVEFYVDNSDLEYLDINTKTIVQTINTAGSLEQQTIADASVVGINPFIDDQTGKVKVIASINKDYLTGNTGSKGLKHNMHVYIYFDKHPIDDVFIVNKAAIVEDGHGNTYVRKVINNNGVDEIMIAKVAVVESAHNLYAIRSEQLRNGDQLVTEGGGKRDGIPVVIKKIYEY